MPVVAISAPSLVAHTGVHIRILTLVWQVPAHFRGEEDKYYRFVILRLGSAFASLIALGWLLGHPSSCLSLRVVVIAIMIGIVVLIE